MGWLNRTRAGWCKRTQSDVLARGLPYNATADAQIAEVWDAGGLEGLHLSWQSYSHELPGSQQLNQHALGSFEHFLALRKTPSERLFSFWVRAAPTLF